MRCARGLGRRQSSRASSGRLGSTRAISPLARDDRRTRSLRLGQRAFLPVPRGARFPFFAAAEAEGAGAAASGSEAAGAADAAGWSSAGAAGRSSGIFAPAAALANDGSSIGAGGLVANCVRFLTRLSGPQSATPKAPAAPTRTTMIPKNRIVWSPERDDAGEWPRRTAGGADAGPSIQIGVF